MTDPDIAERLRAVPLFASVASEHLERLAARASPVRLQAGEWLFHAGEPGDSLYVVVAGRLDIVVEGAVEIVVRSSGRGDFVGELALLTDLPRSLSVRAHRDCELLRVSRRDVEALLLDEPGFGVTLTRALGARLHDQRSAVSTRPALPRTIALVGLHPEAPLADVTAALTAALSRLGRAIAVDEDSGLTLEALDHVEADHDHVVLAATADPSDRWTSFCMRQADRVVAVADRPPAPGRPPHPALRGCDLAFQAAPGARPRLERWMTAVTPRTVHILRRGEVKGVERLARRLAGRALGVVLSGGGARGFAHVGVVEELQRAGLVVDRIGGASIGAMVAALFAEERSPDEVAAVMHEQYVRASPLRQRSIPLVALTKGARAFAAQELLHDGRTIEALDVDFYCVSADLAEQRLVVHRTGPVAVAVSASQALPAFVPPMRDGEHMLVDGAVLNNLPVEPMHATAEGPIIAVDVSGRLPRPGPPRSRIPAPLRRWIIGPAAEWAPPITETILRSILLGNVATDAAARALADVVITPSLRGVSTMRFTDVEGPRRAGREAARAAIEAGSLDRLGLPRHSDRRDCRP